MTVGLAARPTTQSWKIITTPPMSGEANMAYDNGTMARLQGSDDSPTLRLFRWLEPGVSYGRHQHLDQIQTLVPQGWPAVQRPTGGGVVRHDQDLCLSLCWRQGQAPIPHRIKEQYAWIHAVILDGVRSIQSGLRLATCQDCSAAPAPFATRACFAEPVGYDIVSGDRKVVGGALCRRRDVFLYQGSIQGLPEINLEPELIAAFQRRFASR